MGEAGGPTKVTWRLQSAFLWRLDTVSLGKHQRNGVERQGRVTKTSQRIGAHAPTPRQPPAPSQSRAKMSKDNRGSSAHANGGAAEVKKALFFGGSTPFLWASTKEMGSNGRAGQRPPPNVSAHTHKRKEKGGTPGEGSPLDPLLRFNKHKGVPRSAERSQRRCLWTPPAFLKKSGAKNFKLTVSSKSRGAFWSGWGGGACGAPWPLSDGCAHG